MSAGLRNTYEKLVKRGMINDTNPDGTPAKVPDMEEVHRVHCVSVLALLFLSSAPLAHFFP